jgi:hypothetical protein
MEGKYKTGFSKCRLGARAVLMRPRIIQVVVSCECGSELWGSLNAWDVSSS